MPNGANLHSVLMDIEFIFKVDRLCLSSLSGHFNFYISITYEAYPMTFKATLSQTCSSNWKAIRQLVSRHNEQLIAEDV